MIFDLNWIFIFIIVSPLLISNLCYFTVNWSHTQFWVSYGQNSRNLRSGAPPLASRSDPADLSVFHRLIIIFLGLVLLFGWRSFHHLILHFRCLVGVDSCIPRTCTNLSRWRLAGSTRNISSDTLIFGNCILWNVVLNFQVTKAQRQRRNRAVWGLFCPTSICRSHELAPQDGLFCFWRHTDFASKSILWPTVVFLHAPCNLNTPHIGSHCCKTDYSWNTHSTISGSQNSCSCMPWVRNHQSRPDPVWCWQNLGGIAQSLSISALPWLLFGLSIDAFSLNSVKIGLIRRLGS